MANLMERLNEVQDTLTKSHRQVADYIIENCDAVAFYTLQELAEKAGVSTTTIIRFSRALGYSGFAELKHSVQSSVSGKVSLPKRLKIAPVANTPIVKFFQNDVNNLRDTLKYLDQDVLNESIQQIIKAENIYILGLRSSYSLAHFLFVTMGQIKNNVRMLQGTGNAFIEEMINIKKGDVCIVFLFPRYLKATVDIIEFMRRHGVKIIAFTNPFYLPIRDLADYILPCSIQGVSYKDSFVAPMAVINFIIAQVSNSLRSEASDNLQKTEEYFNLIQAFMG